MTAGKVGRPRKDYTARTFYARTKQVGDCLIWQGGLTRGGYGQTVWERRTRRAHRVAYELANGPIPYNMDVLHTCDNPACVNPAHLYLGTDEENQNDANVRQRRKSTKLTPDMVRRMRALRERGMTYTEIAYNFGVSQSTAHKALTGVSHRHVAIEAEA